MKKVYVLIILMVSISGCSKENLSTSAAASSAKIDLPESNVGEENIQQTNTEDISDKDDNGSEDIDESTDITVEPETQAVNYEIDYDEIQPYEVGQIMVIMYHGIEDRETASDVYHCTSEEFKRDLTYFYENGFRLISMEDLVNNNISVEAGKTPLVITFDDGLSSTFSLVEENGALVPAPNCGVDVLNRFCDDHPDFGKAAVFYINDSSGTFKGEGTLKQRLEYLIDNGYEIGNHTATHQALNKLSESEVQYQVGALDNMVNEIITGYKINSLAYPFGIRPIEELREYALKGEYEGREYSYKYAFREGSSGAASAPNRVGFDPLNMPRVRSGDSEATDLWWTLRQYEENPKLRYISDGNPDRISVPKEYEENVDMSSLGDKELFIY